MVPRPDFLFHGNARSCSFFIAGDGVVSGAMAGAFAGSANTADRNGKSELPAYGVGVEDFNLWRRFGNRARIGSVVMQPFRNLLLFLFSHRFLAITRWDLHFLLVRFGNAITLVRWRIRKQILARQRPLFLNLGCGPRGISDPHWVNVDGVHYRNVHFLLDFSRPLPFPDGSFDGVFCEHVLEHFSLDEGQRLVREIRRILRSGGYLRVVVPDAQFILREYFDAPGELVARRGDGDETPMEIVNTYFRQRYEHQFIYDWTTLQKVLVKEGFNEVLRVSFGEERFCKSITLDDEKYKWESLYVEALK